MQRARNIAASANPTLLEAEHFRDVQGFYRPASPPATLRELQPFMAAPHVYDPGNTECQVVAVMVRDAIGDGPPPPVQSAKGWLAQAEAANPPDTEHGRLVRIAGPLLLARYGTTS